MPRLKRIRMVPFMNGIDWPEETVIPEEADRAAAEVLAELGRPQGDAEAVAYARLARLLADHGPYFASWHPRAPLRCIARRLVRLIFGPVADHGGREAMSRVFARLDDHVRRTCDPGDGILGLRWL